MTPKLLTSEEARSRVVKDVEDGWIVSATFMADLIADISTLKSALAERDEEIQRLKIENAAYVATLQLLHKRLESNTTPESSIGEGEMMSSLDSTGGSGESGKLAADNLALVQEFQTLLTGYHTFLDTRIKELKVDDETWSYNEDDLCPGNGDFAAWVKSELVKMGLRVTVMVREDNGSPRVLTYSRIKCNVFDAKTECAALVSALVQVLQLQPSHDVPSGSLPPERKESQEEPK